MHATNIYVLAGDIGGTKSHLGIFFNQCCIQEKKYLNADYSQFSDILSDFLEALEVRLDAVSLGCAGLVKKDSCQLTNFPWVIQAQEISSQCGVDRVFLINDLEAYAYGLDSLTPADFIVLKQGKVEAEGNRAVIAVGTGLGEVGAFWNGKAYRAFASEGGHRDFAPRNDLEIELLLFLKKKWEHVSYERILSGRGIVELFDFLIAVKKEERPDWLYQTDLSHEQLIQIIIENATNKRCSLCEKVILLFASIYGSEVGNVALSFLAMGGIFLAGGIALKIAPFLKEICFRRSFEDKGSLQHLLANIEIKLVTNEKVALLGAERFVHN